MSDSCQPAPIKFRIGHLLNGSRMLLPIAALLIGLVVIIHAQDSMAYVVGFGLMVGGVSDL